MVRCILYCISPEGFQFVKSLRPRRAICGWQLWANSPVSFSPWLLLDLKYWHAFCVVKAMLVACRLTVGSLGVDWISKTDTALVDRFRAVLFHIEPCCALSGPYHSPPHSCFLSVWVLSIFNLGIDQCLLPRCLCFFNPPITDASIQKNIHICTGADWPGFAM